MSKNRSWMFLVDGALAMALLTAGFGFTGAAAAQNNSQTGKDGIQREIQHQLRMLNYYTVFDNLEYGVAGNRVILEGRVTNPEVKSEAVAAVKSVPGVTDVQDDIQVLPLSNEDDRIAARRTDPSTEMRN